MLDIAFELIGEASSNSLLMFCFCNLIIVMILTGSSKPGSMDSQDSTFTTSMSYNMCNIASHNLDSGDDDDDDEEIIVAGASYAKDESLIDVSSVSGEDEDRESIHSCDYDDEDDDDDGDDEDEEEEEEEDDDDESRESEVEEEEEGDDDLRKRVEEFIAKINKEWRHEKLKALNLVY